MAPDDRRWDRLVLLGAVTVLLVVTALQVLPAPERLGSHVAPNAGDPVLITWILEHQARALLSDPGSLYRGNIFFPEPHAIAWSDNLTAFVPPYLLVWLVTGRESVLAYNLVTWLSFAGGAIAVLLLARRLLRSPVAATFVAVAFSVAMVRRSAIGHTQLAGFLFLPLALVLLMDLVERPRLRTAVLAGVCLAGLWYTAIYFFVLAAVVVPVFLVVWAATSWRDVTVRLLGLLGVVALVAGALVAPSLPPYLDLQRRATFERGDDELLTIGASSFPQPPSALYEALGADDGTTEGTDGFVGWTVVVLALVALAGTAARLVARGRRPGAAPGAAATAARHREVDARRRRFALPIAAACAAAALLSLGPDDGLLSVPYRALRPVLPGLESARALNRFWVLPALGLALLAGRGLGRLTGDRSRRMQLAAGALATVVVLGELFVRPGFSEVADAPELLAVNEALAVLPEGPVTELPVPTSPHYPYVLAARQLRSLTDGLPRIEGYSGDAPAGLPEYLQAASAFPEAHAIRAMRQAGVRHVLLHGGPAPCAGRYGPEELDAIVERAAASPDVEAVTRVGDEAVVTLTPVPRGGPLSDIPAVAPVARTEAACERV